jgi:glycosyltransferase involved in cell wall biosynthesis
MAGEAVPRLLHVFSTFAVGGAQMRLAAIANRFGAAFHHEILALDGNLVARSRLRPGLAVSFPNIAVRKGDLVGNLWRFAAALRAWQPDVLVTYNWGTIEWALANFWAGRRHLHVEDGFGPEERDRQLPRRVLTRRLALRRATVVLPSRTLWRIAAECWRLPERRLRYLPNGIDLAGFTPQECLRSDAMPVIGTIAALRPEKNIARLIRACAALPKATPAQLVIVGDGPERASLEALTITLGIAGRVRFTGASLDPARALRDFDIFALSSDTEQMPFSVLEAMGCALPVVATEVGDVAEMLATANQPYVVAREEAAFTGALAALLASPGLRRALGQANRARAEQAFDQEHMLAGWGTLFGAAPP